jgi:hypothetical protein
MVISAIHRVARDVDLRTSHFTATGDTAGHQGPATHEIDSAYSGYVPEKIHKLSLYTLHLDLK